MTNLNTVPLICAVLHHFDLMTLQELVHLHADSAQALLKQSFVRVIETEGKRYRLNDESRATIINKLQNEQPRLERELHRQSMHYFLERMQRRALQHHPLDEIAVFYHLRVLRELNRDYMRLGEIDSLLEALQELPALQPQHMDELSYFRASNLLRSPHADQGEAILHGLLQKADLHSDVRASSLNSLGVLAMNRGHFEQAMGFFEAICALSDNIHQSHIGNALVNLSWVYHQLNHFEKALKLGQQSIEYFMSGQDLYGRAYALYTIGNNALYMGLWNIAQEHLDQAAQIYTAAAMDARSAMVDWARGLLYNILGDAMRSEPAYLRALAFAEHPEHANAITARDTLEMLALFYQSQGRLDEAAAACKRAIMLGEGISDVHRLAQSLHRLGSIELQQGELDSALESLHTAIAHVETIRSATKAEEIKLSLLSTIQNIYESIVLATLQRQDYSSAFALVERARARAFLDLLAGSDAVLAANLDTQPISLAETQALLDPDTLLLEYYTIGVLPPVDYFVHKIPPENQQLREQLLLKPEIFVFAITAKQIAFHRITFDPNILQPSVGDPAPGRHLLTDRKLAWLYEILIGPVREQIAAHKLVYIIPHGPLHYVSFAALRSSDGTTLLNTDGPALAYAPSATVLRTCLERSRSSTQHDAAFGYNGSGPTALRLAEQEARAIGRFVAGSSYVGPENKSAILLERGPQLGRLHIASHAVFQAHDPLGSYLLLGSDDRLDARSIMKNLQLQAELVTLNACTSGLSHVVAGDELLGLPRALLFAGTATVICTLMEVDDFASYLLMVSFYENLAHGQRPAQALHHAQNKLRSMTRDEILAALTQIDGAEDVADFIAENTYPFAHARYWAPCMLIGKG